MNPRIDIDTDAVGTRGSSERERMDRFLGDLMRLVTGSLQRETEGFQINVAWNCPYVGKTYAPKKKESVPSPSGSG